jgi:pimeloyl-ACP methyl ester carboxylesterase
MERSPVGLDIQRPEPNAAGLGTDEPARDPQQRRFARSVRAADPYRRSRLEYKADVVEDRTVRARPALADAEQREGRRLGRHEAGNAKSTSGARRRQGISYHWSARIGKLLQAPLWLPAQSVSQSPLRIGMPLLVLYGAPDHCPVLLRLSQPSQ